MNYELSKCYNNRKLFENPVVLPQLTTIHKPVTASNVFRIYLYNYMYVTSLVYKRKYDSM